MSSSAERAPNLPFKFSDLSVSSQRALSYADAMRRKTDQSQVHMEHLVMGLFVKQDGPAERLFRAQGLDSEHRLREVLLTAAEVRLPEITVDEAEELTEAPPLSRHVREAFEHARAIAERMTSVQVQSRHVLYGVLSVEECHVVRILRAKGIRAEDIPLTDPVFVESQGTPIVGADSDAPGGIDRLGLELEIRALSALVASRDTKTPMSIGLFGNWGSGKSFFMQKMDEQIRDFRRHAETDATSPYCSGIVQLSFNAWHYIDKSLWASLGAEIFEGLAHGLTEAEAKIEGRSKLEDARTDLMVRKAEAESERNRAKEAVIQSTATLQMHRNTVDKISNQSDREIERTLGTRAIVEEVWQVAQAQPQVRRALDDAAKALGWAALDPQSRVADAQVKEILRTASYWRSIVTTLRNRGSAKWWIAVALIAGASVALSQWLLSLVLHLRTTASWLLAVLTALSVATAPVLVIARRITGIVRGARRGLSARISAVRERAIAEAKAQYDAVAQEAEAYREQLATSEQKVSELDTQIDRLKPDRQFRDFIRLRHESNEYTQHFGVIARARQDFEELTRLMELVRTQQDSGAPHSAFAVRPVERIVLYIDDLDRCSEDIVFQVLQAVHLLLAFPLFVVVVGVDPRWLFHSLRTQLAALSDRQDEEGVDEEERMRWQSTPLNYLEKIFQIPFTLRPMADTGFASLVDDLVKPSESTLHRPRGLSAVSAPAPATAPSAGTPPIPPSGDSSPPHVRTSPTQSTPQPAAGTEPVDPATAKETHERLSLTDWEVGHMKQFFALIPSPRATKRFVNVYRLLRGVLTGSERTALVGSATAGGYQCVLLLLAMVTGYPVEAAEVIRELLERAKHPNATDNWWEMLDTIRTKGYNGENERPAKAARHSTNWAARHQTGALDNETPTVETPGADVMFEKLAQIRARAGDDLTVRDMVRWAPVVARYSFASGRLLMADSR